MKATIECYPCLMSQVLSTVTLCDLDDNQRKNVMKFALNVLGTGADDVYPQEVVVQVNEYIQASYPHLPVPFDPYKDIKVKSRQMALGFYRSVAAEIERADDRVELALKCAALGNIIDFGAKSYGHLDVEAELAKLHELDFDIYDYQQFADCLEHAADILYLGDNVGEDVFDKALITEIRRRYPRKTIHFAVRARPVINDVTLADADEIGMGDVARVFTSGSIYPGTILAETTAEFQQLFAAADMIISKGQGNYETLCDETHPDLFFVLRAKCSRVAAALQVRKGAMILKKR